MKQFGYKFLVGIFAVVLHVGLLADTASAAKAVVKTEVSNTVTFTDGNKFLDATVNLYCSIKVGNKKVSSTGTGVMIDSRGVILTNAHVAQYFLLNGENSKLKADCSVRTGSLAKETYNAEVLYISNNWLDINIAKSKDSSIKTTGESDFALLYITDTKKGTLPEAHPIISLNTTDSIKRGAEVKVAGYPSSGLNFKEIRNKLKVVSATTTVTNLQTFHASTTDTIGLSRTQFAGAGVSGGPVVIGNAVVGIVTLSSNSKNEEGSSLRALTTSYINREITKETGLPLNILLMGDLRKRAEITRASISTKALSVIEKSLRVLR